MKSVQCQDCSRKREVEDNIKYPTCACGGVMVESKGRCLTNHMSKANQSVMKQVFQRGVQNGKPLLANDLVEEVKVNKIKVNVA
jgi:hypothetical protein